MNNRRLAIAVMTTAFTATMVSAHLPSASVARNQIGRAHSATASTATRAVVDVSAIKAWPAAPKNAAEVEKGFYVSHGTDKATGKKMYWKASWYPDAADEPGQFADSGGTSAWGLQNSSAFNEGKEYEWTGWNDGAAKWEIKRKPGTWEYNETQVGDWGNQIQSAGAGAYVPTWRDGAEGAYTMIHDDIGAMSISGSVEPANEVGADHHRIRVGWGMKVDVMDNEEWAVARDMVMDGHEILNHSWDHSSAAEQWQWHYMGDTLSKEDPALPKEIRGMVIGTESDTYTKKVTSTSIYIDYKNGDPEQPIELVNEVVYDVTADYTFDSTFIEREDEAGNKWEEVQYESTGKLKPVHKGWDDDAAASVSMLKIFAVPGWADMANRSEVNIKVAKAKIDEELYSQVESPRFPKGKETEYYVYPYDAYSNTTHDLVLTDGHVASRGGAKSGMPIPGDFYQPFRIDFDAFFMLDAEASVTYPENPHQRLSLQGLVERVVKTKGYMIREFHACADVAYWDDANLQSKGGWWGGIPKSLYETHFSYLDGLIDGNQIAVFTPTEAVKYRLTTNSVKGATLNGLELTVDADGCQEQYQDEISVIVKFDSPKTGIQVTYNDGTNPRYKARMMDQDGKAWSVSVNPYVDGGKFTLDDNVAIGGKPNANTASLSYAGIADGKLALSNLSVGEQVTASVYSVNGRKLATTNVMGTAGVTPTNLSTANLGAGMFILNVEKAGVSVMNTKIMVK